MLPDARASSGADAASARAASASNRECVHDRLRNRAPTEFFRWWITDERTGKRRLTTYKMTRADTAERYPGADPNLQTREVRDLPGRVARQHATA